jgi:glutamyl-tRNA reductase
MGLTLVGLNHRTAPVEIRERLYWPVAEVPGVLQKLTGVSGTYAVLLSTCNRTEFYLSESHAQALDVISRQAGARLGQSLDPYAYVLQERDVAEHLFRVAAGMDSLVLGESQVQGQVREAWEAAQSSADSVLHRLFQSALRTGGRVRAETALGAGAASVPSASVELAHKIFGDLSGRKALVLGSGEMAELAMGLLVSEGVRTVMVAHRHLEHAAQVAEKLGGRAVEYGEAWPMFAEVDIVMTSTAAPHAIVTMPHVGEVVARRGGRPLCILDIAVPRDVDPAVGRLDNVFLYDIDDLQGVVAATIGIRRREMPAAERIVQQELRHFWDWYGGRGAVDAIRQLREHAESLRAAELERALRRLAHLDPADRERVEYLTRALMNKFLHAPTLALRAAAGNGNDRELAEAIRRLFDLGEGLTQTEEGSNQQ